MKKTIFFLIAISTIGFTLIPSCKEEITGCLYDDACNYNSSATEDDGSCNYPDEYYDCNEECLNDVDNDGICDELENSGCTIPSACNYDPTATNNDGSCFYANEYYDCAGNCLNDFDNDGICDELEIDGCNDPEACNYAPNATDLGDCEYAEGGYNCDGSVNTFYTVDQLFGFGVTFNEITQAGIIPNIIKITEISITGCTLNSGDWDAIGCPDIFLQLTSFGNLVSQTGVWEDDCTTSTEIQVYNNAGFPILISSSQWEAVSLLVFDDDAIGASDYIDGIADFNFWDKIVDTNEFNLLNESPSEISILNWDQSTCPTATFTFELIWD